MDEDWNVRDRAAEALGWMSCLEESLEAVDPLMQALKDENRDVRRRAAWALGMIGDIRAVDPLTQALKDKDSLVRQTAKKALDKRRWRRRRHIKLI